MIEDAVMQETDLDRHQINHMPAVASSHNVQP